jgi:hypothetical protein
MGSLGLGAGLPAFDVALSPRALFDFVVLLAHKVFKESLLCHRVSVAYETMKFRLARFNTYLWLPLGAALLLGCQTGGDHKKEPKAPKKGYSTLRLHLEVNADGTAGNMTVNVGREIHFPVNVVKEAFVDENSMTRASVVDDGMGGFAFMIHLNRQGSWLLEQHTVANKGRRIAVYAELDEFHWLAAPLITKKISDGVFTFTPDATREEAENLALGLTKTIKKLQERTFLKDVDEK